LKRLIVYWDTEKVGVLEQDDSGLLQFRYAREWLDQKDAVPLSRSLPIQGETFRGIPVRSFFAGILPEENPRKQLAALLGISESNDFAMLESIGGECAGAVSLFPEEGIPGHSEEPHLRDLDDWELQEIITELPRRPLMAGKDGIRLSLAGAQDKLPVVVTESGIHLPLGGTPSTHILKPEPERFPGLAANEFFCMSLARAIGMKSPRVRCLRFGDKPSLLVERFDRKIDSNGIVTRIHQEDFCQALGFPPERKYQEEGGPHLRQCMALLREWSTVPVIDLSAFVDGLIFNVLIGNGDAHAKNYSLLYQAGERSLTPFYDLVCTMAWPELTRNMAMKIGGCGSLDEINGGHWRKMAKETGLAWPGLRDRLFDASHRVLDALPTVQEMTDEVDSSMAKRLDDIISHRGQKLLQQLKSDK
jgi:serine/threonine-protein kinase HipA